MFLIGLKYTDIIYFHCLRKAGTGIRTSGQVSTNSDIKNEEKGIVKWINTSCIYWSYGMVFYVVYKPFNFVFFPIYGEYVELIGKIARGQPVFFAIKLGRNRGSPMCGTKNFSRFMSNRLHDVDLSTSRPTNTANITTQHPKCRP